MARFAPEGAGRLGVPGIDEQIFDLKPGVDERRLRGARPGARRAARAARSGDRPRGAAGPRDPDPARRRISGGAPSSSGSCCSRTSASRKRCSRACARCSTTRSRRARRAAALVRLRKYAGMEPGTEPIAKLAEARIRERLADAALLGPFRPRSRRAAPTTPAFVDGIAELFEKYRIEGWRGAVRRAARSSSPATTRSCAKEVLPRARTDFRQPPELYAYGLEQVGVDMPVDGAGEPRAGRVPARSRTRCRRSRRWSRRSKGCDGDRLPRRDRAS